MKKQLLLLSFLFLINASFAQQYAGYHSSNYAGVHGMLSNPSSIVNSKLRSDINLLSADVLFSNSTLEFDVTDIEVPSNISREFDLIADVGLLGPSVFFKFGNKSALGIHSKGRLMANITDFDSDLFDQIEDSFNSSGPFIINESDGFSLIQNAWAELGVTYAMNLLETRKHRISGGIGLKYLHGGIASELSTSSLNLNSDGTNVTINGNITYNATTDLFGSTDFNDTLIDNNVDGSGFSADIGITYFLKDTQTVEDDYRLKLGAAVTDIGKMVYELENAEYVFNNVNATENELNNIGETESLSEFLQRKATSTSSIRDVDVYLPTQLNINADVKLNKNFYLNANSSLSLVDPLDKFATSALTHHTLTPRFESKFFELWSPVGIDEFENFTWGAGFRLGPLFVGSRSVLSTLISSETKIADIYGGLKIPILPSRTRRDSDGDGVIDRIDRCRNVPGIRRNDGCPKEKEVQPTLVPTEVDSDGDGVLDNKDNCPEKAGDKKNKGCPWGDRDEDGVKDNEDECPEVPGTKDNDGCPVNDFDGDKVPDIVDKCPEKAGDLLNNGCPSAADKDGDKVPDGKDACPDLAGSIANNGCPVTLKEVENFRRDLREIFFDSGSSLVNSYAAGSLKSAMKVMNKFPDMYWIVEGHTDSKGAAFFNQRLSEARAESVKLFLIKNGIDATKVTSIGYGESRPQTTNATENGRAKNRRVEIRAADRFGNLVGMELPKEDVAKEISNLAKFIYFETGSNIIIDNSKAQLDQIAYYIKKFKGHYEIQGHTDSVGSEINNLVLSQRRADAVFSYLINKAVPATSIRAVGYGESNPVADNSTKDGQATNRRIEIVKDVKGAAVIQQKVREAF